MSMCQCRFMISLGLRFDRGLRFRIRFNHRPKLRFRIRFNHRLLFFGTYFCIWFSCAVLATTGSYSSFCCYPPGWSCSKQAHVKDTPWGLNTSGNLFWIRRIVRRENNEHQQRTHEDHGTWLMYNIYIICDARNHSKKNQRIFIGCSRHYVCIASQ